ncbi:MAG: M20/M25/M40 family metallo-hydrolase [Pseudomonadota bacterium]
MVAFDTQNPGGDEGVFAVMLKESLEEFKPDELRLEHVTRSDNVPGSWVFARWGTPKLLINIHIDTVPAGTGWATPPHELKSHADKLVGLGSADTKGAIAAVLTALELIGQKPKDCAILLSGDEERNSECMEHFLKTVDLSHIKQAIVCEPTGCQVGQRHRGIFGLSVAIEGKGGHSSLADHTTSPLLELSCVSNKLGSLAIEELDKGPEGFKGLCLNIANISGGTEYNVIPRKGQLTFSVRPRPGSVLSETRKTINELVMSNAPNAILTEIIAQPSFETSALDDFVKWFPAECQKPLNLGFWTEAALLAECGINTIVFGPGVIEEAHKPNESVPIEHLLLATNRFIDILPSNK